jgi:pimeloyl-ACP methyl ester carboxylesterase
MKQLLFQDKKIFYRVEGEGNMVVLLHGFAEDGRIWDFQVEKLKEDYRLIIPDLPGSGNSEMLGGEVSIMDYSNAVKLIADAEIKNGSNTFTIIGHSMGGYIALAFAEKDAARLNGLGLFHSSSYADDEQKKETRRKGIAFINKNGPKAFFKNTIPNLFSEMTTKESPELIEQLVERSKHFNSEVLIQYYNAMIKRPDRSGVLKSFTKPVLFIQGLQDTAVPIESGLEQSNIASVTFFHILKNSGHMGMWEEKDAATIYMKQFLEQL